MKICVVGNSHLAAIKLGWDISPLKDEHQATFFGASGLGLKCLTVVEGALQPTDEVVATSFGRTAGRQTIEGDYDLFVIVGCSIGTPNGLATFKTHQTDEIHRESGSAHLISESCLTATMRGLIEHSLATNVAGKIRQISSAPIALLPSPNISHDVLGDKNADFWRMSDIRVRASDHYWRLADEILSPSMTVCRQPEETVVDGVFTEAAYSRNAKRIWAADPAATQPPTDRLHMNAEFGALHLEKIFA